MMEDDVLFYGDDYGDYGDDGGGGGGHRDDVTNLKNKRQNRLSFHFQYSRI